MSSETAVEEAGDISTGSSSMSLEWKIPKFFSLPQQVVYEIQSPRFHFLEGTWYFNMCPNGESAEGCISLYLYREKPRTPEYRIRYRLKLRTKDGAELLNHSSEEDFSENLYGWGETALVARSQLLWRKDTNPEGIVIVSCDMCAKVPKTIETGSQTESHKGVDKLAENIKELYFSGGESDITLNVRGREFKCHRAVLVSRSSVFAAMLRQDMLERTTGVVQIEDCEPEAFQEFLIYLYSGCVEDFTKENVFGLYQIADKYDAPEVKARCVQLLTIGLCVENFCNVVDLSLQYSESEVLQTAVTFFAKNTKSILLSPRWLNFMKKNPVGANELHLKCLDMR